ncbi:hypothetical protein [Citrobacter sp. JGM124]|uniref:4'-phosphopantetheinyl transferase family protein n=1 Tax=Citrobacter sp. JGM124 TaxID=2799789 RepID=UPI001BA6A0BC|nr:hypothetical protein [Citrobacter sp. JGM124]MBS0848101.1 hypothetical protein [Citrobacter sp. JGM124]
MAVHFARGSIALSNSVSSHLNEATLDWASRLPPYRRTRYLASRSLLAELLFMLYGIKWLPDIELSVSGRPHFSDTTMPDFSIAYAGNIVGILLTPEGRCGLDMKLHGNFAPHAQDTSPYGYSGNEIIWANNQLDPNEARSQLSALRQSILKLTETSSKSLQLLPISGRLKIEDAPHIKAVSDVEDILVWGCATTPGTDELELWMFNAGQEWQRLTDIRTRSQSPNSRVMQLTTMPYHSLSPRR